MMAARSALKALRRKIAANARSIAWRFATGCLVLNYHRVEKAVTDPWELCVWPEHFEAQLAMLRRRGIPILTLPDLIMRLESKDTPQRAVVITFDDGYADNLIQAKPVLERFDAPATVFVSAGLVGASQEFWWDELDLILLQPRELPATLTLDLPYGCKSWTLGTSTTLTSAEHSRYATWRVGDPPPTPRHAAYRDIWAELVKTDPGMRESILAQLRGWAQSQALARDSHRTLSEEELRRLSAGGLIEIGAHTMTHVSLRHQPLGDQRAELEQSKARLESILGRAVNGMSYPHGNHSPEILPLVRNAGYAYACASHPGLVRAHADHLRLPRVPVGNWTGPEFERMLPI